MSGEISTILTDAKGHLNTFGLCQGAYALDDQEQPVAGKAGALDSGLTAIDILGAIHRAAHEGSLLAFEEAARSAVAGYLGYAQREDTSGTVIRVWNDEPSRETTDAVNLLDTVLASL